MESSPDPTSIKLPHSVKHSMACRPELGEVSLREFPLPVCLRFAQFDRRRPAGFSYLSNVTLVHPEYSIASQNRHPRFPITL